jgi:nucleoside-diphosphate-sugar epimerase
MTDSDRRIYVTGTAGLIGSNVARALLDDGHAVIGIDNFWRGTQENVRQLSADAKFEFRHADLVADQRWFQDMKSSDVLIHIADIVAGIGYVFSNEWEIFQKNVLINTSVARVVAQKSPARLIYLGTACSYPQAMQRSVTSSILSEADKFPADPESGYGWSKLIGEIEFRLVTKGSATKLVVLDLHNVYGWPCAYSDGTAQVIPSLINRAISTQDHTLSVWGDGRQGRAFLHVSDVVSAIRLALDYGGSLSTFMIGPSSCTTIAEVVRIIQAHPKIQIKEIVFDTSKPTGDIGRFANPAVANKELGWTLKMDLVAGIHDLVDKILDDRT